MTTAFPALEATLIRPQATSPSLERPRLYVEGEILPALYHYMVQASAYQLHTAIVVPGQHEIEAAEYALKLSSPLREAVGRSGEVTVTGVDSRGSLGEYPVTIRVDQDGAVAIPP